MKNNRMRISTKIFSRTSFQLAQLIKSLLPASMRRGSCWNLRDARADVLTATAISTPHGRKDSTLYCLACLSFRLESKKYRLPTIKEVCLASLVALCRKPEQIGRHSSITSANLDCRAACRCWCGSSSWTSCQCRWHWPIWANCWSPIWHPPPQPPLQSPS